jgi:hypothetical protein
MLISEPITTLTDYAIAGEALIFAGLLLKPNPKSLISPPVLFWAAAFVGVAIAALCGGTYHGFYLSLPIDVKWALWRGLTYALSFSSGCMLAAAVSELPQWVQAWAWGAIGLKSALYLSWTAFHPNFVYIIVDYLSAMLLILLLQIRATDRQIKGRNSSAWIVAGVLGSLVAAGVQGIGFKGAEYFNQNDLYHLVQMVALYFFYRGACVIKHSGFAHR